MGLTVQHPRRLLRRQAGGRVLQQEQEAVLFVAHVQSFVSSVQSSSSSNPATTPPYGRGRGRERPSGDNWQHCRSLDDAMTPVRSFTARLGWSEAAANLEAVWAVIASPGTASREIVLLRLSLSSTASLSYQPPAFNDAEDRLGQHDVAVSPKLAGLIIIPSGAPILCVAAFEDIAHTVEQRAIDRDARHPAPQSLPNLHEGETGGRRARVLGNPRRATELPPMGMADGDAYAEFQARRLGRIFSFYQMKLPPAELRILQALCVFRLPIPISIILGLFSQNENSRLRSDYRMTEVTVRSVLAQLRSKRLVGFEDKGDKLTCAVHPSVRDYFYRTLGEVGRDIHANIRDQLVSLTERPNRSREPFDSQRLDLLEELVYHTLQTGDVTSAMRAYSRLLGG